MNSIIYGHHMEKDAMFGELEYYQEPSYFQKHSCGKIYYEGKWDFVSKKETVDIGKYKFNIR